MSITLGTPLCALNLSLDVFCQMKDCVSALDHHRRKFGGGRSFDVPLVHVVDDFPPCPTDKALRVPTGANTDFFEAKQQQSFEPSAANLPEMWAMERKRHPSSPNLYQLL
jgi:hypothetical protein